MRVSTETMGGRRKMVLGGCVLLAGFAAAEFSECAAQMHYSGGFVPTRRSPSEFTLRPAPTPTPAVPMKPRDYFPDSDYGYSSISRGEVERSLYFPAGLPPFGIAAAALPWNQVGFEDYNEPRPAHLDGSISTPQKYSLQAAPLSLAAPAAPPETAVLIAHLPDQAAFWVEGTRTRSTGRTRFFQSPPLLPGRKYTYRVRAAWIEDGHLVSQTRVVPVRAGTVEAIYLRPGLASESVKKASKE